MKKNPSNYISFEGPWLGDVVFSKEEFDSSAYEKLNNQDFDKVSNFEVHLLVGKVLLEQIQKSSTERFLFPSIISFIEQIRENILDTYVFASFELFLENYSSLTKEEIIYIRGKIIGRSIPRSDYQCFFPLGLGKTYKGSHFSIAHFSPDIDTVIASFHGFMDAFAARVGDGCHYWQVPLGPPKSCIEIENLFMIPFGESIFDILSKTSRDVSVSSLDILSQHNITLKNIKDTSIGSLKGRDRNSVIVTNDEGGFVADWRNVDFDEVLMIIRNYTSILRAFEKKLYMIAVGFLVRKIDIVNEIESMLESKLVDFLDEDSHDGESAYRLGIFISKVLGFSSELSCSFSEILQGSDHLKDMYILLSSVDSNCKIEQCLQAVQKGFSQYFAYLETFEIAIAIKRKVLNIIPVTASHLDDFRSINDKIESFSHLTVVHEEDNLSTPLGVISREDLKGSIATASLRDFSNSEEMEKPAYIEIISCIDHHKSDLKTHAPATMIVSDAQSSNSMVASLNMEINRSYATRGYTKKSIENQIEETKKAGDDFSNIRILQNLLQRKKVLAKAKHYYVNKDKEFIDYYHFLFAILDDTDLLTKVTPYDVFVVRDLLNNLKSLMLEKEVEIVDFDNLDRDKSDFAKHAAKKLLQTHDLYSLYSENYKKKEKNVELCLKKATSSLEIPFFQDTKVINRYAQVGQFKLFSSNFSTFKKKKSVIKKHWINRCIEANKENASLELFVFMISTLDSAEDLFQGNVEQKSNEKDEIWITCVNSDRNALARAKRFIYNFLRSSNVNYQDITIVLEGSMDSLEKGIVSNFSKVCCKVMNHAKCSVADIFIDQRSIKSRKTDIAPYI